MPRYFPYFFAAFAIAISSCKSVSKYTIDETAIVKADSGLLGTWKAVEDTDKANFILVQSPYDGYDKEVSWYNLDNNKKLAYIKEVAPERLSDSNFIAMLFYKDSVMLKKDYNDFIQKENYYYYITYFNHHGKNPLYQQWSAFPSEVKGARFINITYHYVPIYENPFRVHSSEEVNGYFFVRLIRINASHDTLTTAIIADTTLKNITNSKRLRRRIENNINNPHFYSDTLHFYKVNGYHLSLNESIKKAN